ncbi:unnamed protein product [Sympodiomycopsis kandeliae]
MTKHPSTTTSKHVVIVGSGVIGLSIAIEAKSRGYDVTILARDLPPEALPSDSSLDTSSQDWSSPWAGFNWCSFATPEDTMTQQRDRATFEKWCRMVQDRVLPAQEMEMMTFIDYKKSNEEIDPQLTWFSQLVPEFKSIPATDTSPPAISFKSICVSTPHYLAYLVRTALEGDNPVKFHKVDTFSSLGSIFSHPVLQDVSSDDILLVNATGLGSLYLSDVKDESVYPIRGQTIILQSDHFKHSPKCFMSTLTPQPTYIIPRAASGLVILGGTFGINDRNRKEDPKDTDRILRDTYALCPQLLNQPDGSDAGYDALERLKSQIVSVCVGTRPARKGETRVELDAVRCGNDFRPVLHAYGAGKAGFQSSIGIAHEALDFIDGHFKSIKD